MEDMYTDASVKSKLIISKVNAADSGRYVCVAENSLGKHEAAMELEIKGAQRSSSSSSSPSPQNRSKWEISRNNSLNVTFLKYFDERDILQVTETRYIIRLDDQSPIREGYNLNSILPVRYDRTEGRTPVVNPR